MNTIAGAFLVMLLIIMFENYVAGVRGTGPGLGQWFRAKFFNDPGTGK